DPLVTGVQTCALPIFAAPGDVEKGFNPDPNQLIDCTAVQPDGKIAIGGDFTTVAGTARGYLARLNVDGTLDTGFNPNANGAVLRSEARRVGEECGYSE